MPELASPPSITLAHTEVTSVTPNGSAPTVLTQCHPHLTLPCRAPCWKCGQVLQKEGEDFISLCKCRARRAHANTSESSYSQASFYSQKMPWSISLVSFFSPKQANTILPMICGVRCSHTCWKITICSSKAAGADGFPNVTPVSSL